MSEIFKRAVKTLDVNGTPYRYVSLRAIEIDAAYAGLAKLPLSLRVLAENLARHAASPEVDVAMLQALARGERGIPDSAHATLVEGRWQPGRIGSRSHIQPS